MSGVKEAIKDEQYYSMPFGALRELAKVYRYGSQKYGPYNYLAGYKYSLSIDALFRHLMAWLDPEEYDNDESGMSHIVHVAWHALNLAEMELRKEIKQYGDFDDRQGTAYAHDYKYYEASGFHKAER